MAEDPTLAGLFAAVSSMVGRRNLLLEQQSDWATGTASGGPNGDGHYPIDDASGSTHLLPSVPAIAAQANAGAAEAGAAAGSATAMTAVAYTFVTFSQIATITVPPAYSMIRTTGYAKAGDNGDAIYHRVGSQPAHPGAAQDASGAWFEQEGPEFRPQQFGRLPGNANATDAFVKADACAAALGGYVQLRGPGTWNVADFVQTCSLINGEGRLITRVRRALATATAVWSLATGAVAMTVQDFTIDGTSAADAHSLLSLGDFYSDIVVQRMGFENGMNRWALRGDPTTPYQRLTIVDNYFKNCPQGGLIILGQGGSRGARTARINRNTFEKVGGNICSIRGGAGSDGLKWNGVIDVEGNDNVITNCLPTGSDGPIPFEFWGCTNGQHMRNKIDSGTRGLGMGAEMQNFEIAFNDVANQSAYAIEGGTCRNVWIHHNRARNCRTLIPVPLSNETDNLVIEDNSFLGTGLTSYSPTNPADIIFVGGFARGLRIRRNKIVNAEYARTAIYVSLSRPVPTITLSGAGSGAVPVVTLKAVRVRLRTGNGGTGYTNPTVSVQGGGGTGMAITATVDANGILTGGTITNAGTGYSIAPTLVVTDPTGASGELEVLMGIEAITSTGGTGYSNGTWTAGGNGILVGATGTFTVDSGAASAFVVTNAGEGFGRVSDGTIEDVEIVGDTYLSTPNGINAGGNVRIVRPIIRRTARLDSAHYLIASGASANQINFPVHASPLNNPLSIVQDPICEMSGVLDASVGFFSAIGGNQSSQPMYGLNISGGRISGSYTQPVLVPDTSGTAKIGVIDVTGVGSPATAISLNAAVTRRRTRVVIEGTAAPTTGTWQIGDIVEHSAPTASSPMRWQCITGGSPGIWAARSGVGSDPTLASGYQLLSAYTSSYRLVMLANPATTVMKIRSESLTGTGQPTVTLRLLWSGRLNNAPRGGEVTVSLGSYDKSDASPSTAQIGDAVSIASAADSTGRMEITITFPVNAAPWVSVEGITNAPTSWAKVSTQAA